MLLSNVAQSNNLLSLSGKQADVAKASLILSLIQFTRWPQIDATATQLNLCVAPSSDNNQLTQLLIETNGIKHSKHQVQIIQFEQLSPQSTSQRTSLLTSQQIAKCHILVASEQQQINNIATIIKQQQFSILTINSNTVKHYHRLKTMIGFITKGNSISFIVNRKTAAKSKIKFSSRMLRLAAKIQG